MLRLNHRETQDIFNTLNNRENSIILSIAFISEMSEQVNPSKKKEEIMISFAEGSKSHIWNAMSKEQQEDAIEKKYGSQLEDMQRTRLMFIFAYAYQNKRKFTTFKQVFYNVKPKLKWKVDDDLINQIEKNSIHTNFHVMLMQHCQITKQTNKYNTIKVKISDITDEEMIKMIVDTIENKDDILNIPERLQRSDL